MTLFKRDGKYHTTGTQTIHIVGGEVGDITIEEIRKLKDIGVIEIRPLLRTKGMVAEFMHHRASHVVTFMAGAVELLTLQRRLKQEEKNKVHLEKDRDMYYSLFKQARSARQEKEIELNRLKRSSGDIIAKLREEVARWAPAFEVEGIPVFLVEYDGTMKGDRVSKGVKVERQKEYLSRKATFKPASAITEVGFYCHKSKRVAWQLKGGLVVVDDFGPSLAVHIMNSLELAKAVVSKAITIAEAKKSPHHLARIEHSEGYEDLVNICLEECA